MDQNLVVTMPQVTIDRTFMVAEEIGTIVGAFLDRGLFPEHRDLLRNIADFGLKQDHNIRLKFNSLTDLGGALEHLKSHYPGRELAQIGGNSGIAVLRGYYLAAGGRDPSLPLSLYSGSYPPTLEEFIQAQEALSPRMYKSLREVFDKARCVETPKRPMTLALEGRFKIIMAYGEGRTLDCIDPKGEFSTYLDRLEKVVARHKGRNVLFSFPSVPHPLDLAARLFAQIRERFGSQALFFFGCSSFREGTGLNPDRALSIWDSVLREGHILSMNETELGDLHTVVVGKGTHQDKPLAYKLLELPTEAIKVCHGADGALMDPGPHPESTINAEAFRTDPGAFLEESLRLAADGASYSLAQPYGHDATEASVRVFSRTVQSRNFERFKATFLNVLETMPPGLIAVNTPVVARTMSALTGVGARFDGLLATFLMRS